MKRIHFFFIVLLPIQWIVIKGIQKKPQGVETYYSEGLYPFIFNFHRYFFNRIPFSVGDLLYGLGLLFFLKLLIDLFQKKISFSNVVFNGLSLFSLLLLLFQLNWGLNYYRLPLHQKLNYNLNYTEEELHFTLDQLITKTNSLHDKLNNNDTIAVQISHAKSTLAETIERKFQFDLLKYNHQPYIKNSLWSSLLSYMGYAGYLNPLTLESQANQNIPKLSYIVTTAHEMVHQLGIASEREANFIAFYSSIHHPDPFIQYAGYTFALRYCYSERFKAHPEKARKQLQNLNKGVLKNFQELSQFWKKYQNPFEPILKKGYDSYLKANGQPQGIQSYDAMVGLVVAYTLKEYESLDKID